MPTLIYAICRKRFADMMRFMTREPGLEPEHIVNGYPWAELGEATVVDLGGSHGAISCALARKYPSLKLVVQVRDDAPRQVENYEADCKLIFPLELI